MTSLIEQIIEEITVSIYEGELNCKNDILEEYTRIADHSFEFPRDAFEYLQNNEITNFEGAFHNEYYNVYDIARYFLDIQFSDNEEYLKDELQTYLNISKRLEDFEIRAEKVGMEIKEFIFSSYDDIVECEQYLDEMEQELIFLEQMDDTDIGDRYIENLGKEFEKFLYNNTIFEASEFADNIICMIYDKIASCENIKELERFLNGAKLENHFYMVEAIEKFFKMNMNDIFDIYNINSSAFGAMYGMVNAENLTKFAYKYVTENMIDCIDEFKALMEKKIG